LDTAPHGKGGAKPDVAGRGLRGATDSSALLYVLDSPSQRFADDTAALRAIPQFEKEFAAGADLLRAQPGPALCKNLLLCYAAGKPMTFDVFAIDQLVKTGTLPEQRLVRMIDAREYPVIQLDISGAEPLTAEPRQRFPASFMRQLLTRYQPVLRTSSFTVFTPMP
jgi:hypothetical protein